MLYFLIGLIYFGIIFSKLAQTLQGMKKYVIVMLLAALSLGACKSKMEGMQEVKTPFTGSKYEGNARWFRAVASGESMNLETSKDKALLSAKQRLAASVQTQVKNVTESYKGERMVGDDLGDFNERFQQLTREVMNQILVEVQTIDEKVYQNNTNKHYTTWVALEARKRTVYKKLKEIANTRTSLSEKDKVYITKMMDEAIKDLNDNE
jgi:hypothetical protein